MLLSWKQFCQAVEIETLDEILYSPIWFNSNLNRGHNLFIKEWYDKGLRNVIDLLNAEGQFYHFNELKDTYYIHGTFFRLPVNSEKITCLLEKQNKPK